MAAGCGGGSGGADAGFTDGLDGAGAGPDMTIARDARDARGGAIDSRYACPGPILASWTVDGVDYVSSTSLFQDIGATWLLTLVECLNDGTDRTLQFTLLPTPLAVGTYPLTYTSLHAQPWNGQGGAFYSASSANGPVYFTTDAHSGQLTVTAVDATALKFSGTFSFDAISDAGDVAHITNGRLDNIPYQVLQP